MIKDQNTKQYNLDERTYRFAQQVRILVNKIPRILANIEDGKQLLRSSGSVGANYIEASESISKKDFYHRIKICRKEAKESRFWLRLLDMKGNVILEKEKQDLINEAYELTKIFGAIVAKST